MSTRTTILASAASNNGKSINKRFAEHAASVLKSELMPEVEIELNDYEMPIYSPDRKIAEGIPPKAQMFYDKIGAADGLINSYAEYNGSYTAAFKNVFDWASRIEMKIYQGKPVVVLARSPGAGGGKNVLKTVMDAAPFFGANIKGNLSIGPYDEHVETGRLSQPEQMRSLRNALISLRGELSVSN